MKRIAFIFMLLCLGGCRLGSESGEIQDTNLYSECLSPIFYVGEIDIENPEVILRDSGEYVISGNTGYGNQRRDIGVYLTDSLFWSRYNLFYSPMISYPVEMEYIADNILPCDNLSKREMCDSVYDFARDPEKFLLLMISDEVNEICVQRDSADLTDCQTVWNTALQTSMFMDANGHIECRSDYISGYRFSRNYIPAVFPVYSQRDKKMMIRDLESN